MQKFISTDLLNELQADVRQLIATATLLKLEDPGCLLEQPAPGKWNVVQVLEHLNSYGRYYLVAIENSLQLDKKATVVFRSGWLGNYFTNLMKPGADGQIKSKMKAPKDHRPLPQLDVFPVLNTFIDQQQYLLELLEKAKIKDIGAIRTPISISRFIRLKLGDTFRFLVAHEQRHFVQLQNILRIVQEDKRCYKKTGSSTKPVKAV